jgi:malonate transporter
VRAPPTVLARSRPCTAAQWLNSPTAFADDMQHVLTTVAPIFALLALGYCAGRFSWVGEPTAKGLADFTFNLAIPALLFRATATAHLPAGGVFGIWAAYFGAVVIVWIAATVTTRILLRRPDRDGPPIAMSSGFGNIVMLGIPLAIGLYGDAATPASAMIASLHSPLLWLIASVHMTIADRTKATSVSDMATALFRDLSRNTIILAIIAGTLWRLTGFGIHPVPLKIISMLAQAGIPCALVSLGLSLVNFRIAGQKATLTMILVLKLVAMPALAWALATFVFALPPVETGIITVFAAMPTGANAYLFANRHGIAMNSASGSVALGTIISALTASVIVFALSGGRFGI